ncbi:hypothetical protein B7494_g8265 [Chlorociboria aeruginascens]|nr:hypothetical protein B7494_g8265 [Chlorociboria aeruginascens]
MEAPDRDANAMVRDRRQAVREALPSRVLSKPIPQAQAEDPREFQLAQIRRRFCPQGAKQDGTTLRFSVTPSDPDFPFEIEALECILTVPPEYPQSPPRLKVGNKDIPRGFAINIENGFDGLVHEDITLLELMKALDKNLEAFLSVQKAETVKLVPNKDTRHLSTLPVRSVGEVVRESSPVIKETVKPIKCVESFTEAHKAEASKRRAIETRQLEARMGRLPLYMKSGDGIAYTIPIEPRKRGELPPCRVRLEGGEAEGKAVETAFEQKADAQRDLNLMGHINYLSQNIHIFAKTALKPEQPTIPALPTEPRAIPEPKGKSIEGTPDPEKNHIQYIQRPSEWEVVDTEEASDSESSIYSYDSSNESEHAISNEPSTSAPSQPSNPEHGTAISFPFLILQGIELLELTILNLILKCERCKTQFDIKGLKIGEPKKESCRKCATGLSVGYRRDFMHVNSVRAGFLDLEGTFIPTCTSCSSVFTPGITTLRGETRTQNCRTCHAKLTLSLPTLKFLLITPSSAPSSSTLPRRAKRAFGIVSGTPLPKQGRCKHYRKSYRWFRFSCCAKVYACDRCHDEAEDHANEWANRMLCGWCSREGAYRPLDCGFCHAVLVGKKGNGFWEGGRGTRDRVMMRRKDGRKFRRVGGSGKKVV